LQASFRETRIKIDKEKDLRSRRKRFDSAIHWKGRIGVMVACSLLHKGRELFLPLALYFIYNLRKIGVDER